MRSQVNSDIRQSFANLNPPAQEIGGVPYTATELKYSWVIFSKLPDHTSQYLCRDGLYRHTPSGPNGAHAYYKELSQAESVWLEHQDKHVAKKLAVA